MDNIYIWKYQVHTKLCLSKCTYLQCITAVKGFPLLLDEDVVFGVYHKPVISVSQLSTT